MARLTKQERFDRADSIARWVFGSGLSPDQSVKEFEKVVENVGIDTMWFFFREILEKKFQLGAAQKYGYKQRNFQYQKFKREHKPKGGRVEPPLPALVFTGRLKQQVTSRPHNVPRATKTSAGFVFSVSLSAPSYAAQNKHVNILAELRLHARADDLLMAKHFEMLMMDVFGAPQVRVAA